MQHTHKKTGNILFLCDAVIVLWPRGSSWPNNGWTDKAHVHARIPSYENIQIKEPKNSEFQIMKSCCVAMVLSLSFNLSSLWCHFQHVAASSWHAFYLGG
jgi:hypothetical protein